MPTTITICDTCRFQGADPTDEKRDGTLLAELIEAAAETTEGVETRRHSCLMGCEFGCNVAIQSADKISYVLGNFTPDTDSAEGIVAYAALHAESETGQVPYKTWPAAIKGHFRARMPVLEDE